MCLGYRSVTQTSHACNIVVLILQLLGAVAAKQLQEGRSVRHEQSVSQTRAVDPHQQLRAPDHLQLVPELQDSRIRREVAEVT